jgi:hypothetical protein
MLRGVGAALKVGAHLALAEGRGMPPGKILKLESLKYHFMHFRRRFT